MTRISKRIVACVVSVFALFLASAGLTQSDGLRSWHWTENDRKAAQHCVAQPVMVIQADALEKTPICAAARTAIKALARCGIPVRQTLRITVNDIVLHPNKGVVFGLYHTQREEVIVARRSSVSALIAGTPYAVIGAREFHASLVVHEVVHAIMEQNLVSRPTNRAAVEYPAYALQISSLTPATQRAFVRAFPSNSVDGHQLNDMLLALNPHAFAALAYRHYEAESDKCDVLRNLLKGKVSFIRDLPTL